MNWFRKRWALRDYCTADGSVVSEQFYITRRAAERTWRWHSALCGTRGGAFELRIEPVGDGE